MVSHLDKGSTNFGISRYTSLSVSLNGIFNFQSIRKPLIIASGKSEALLPLPPVFHLSQDVVYSMAVFYLLAQ